MEYSDNYPNGHKSGYNSWDDPDRTISSPRVGVPGPSMDEPQESASERYWNGVRQRQAEQERLEAEETEKRIYGNERREKEHKVAAIMRSEILEAYSKQSWFKRLAQKRKGNDPYSRQSEIFKQAVEQARAMSDSELDDIIRRGRTR